MPRKLFHDKLYRSRHEVPAHVGNFHPVSSESCIEDTRSSALTRRQALAFALVLTPGSTGSGYAGASLRAWLSLRVRRGRSPVRTPGRRRNLGRRAGLPPDGGFRPVPRTASEGCLRSRGRGMDLTGFDSVLPEEPSGQTPESLRADSGASESVALSAVSGLPVGDALA
jgi:hypothetical protein